MTADHWWEGALEGMLDSVREKVPSGGSKRDNLMITQGGTLGGSGNKGDSYLITPDVGR